MIVKYKVQWCRLYAHPVFLLVEITNPVESLMDKLVSH